MKWKISKIEQLRQRQFWSHDLKGDSQVNLKIMSNCLYCQILFWKFCFVLFYGFPCSSVFSLLVGVGGGESPREGVPTLAEDLFILPVESPNQVLIPLLNNDFQVITQYKLQKTPSKIVLPPFLSAWCHRKFIPVSPKNVLHIWHSPKVPCCGDRKEIIVVQNCLDTYYLSKAHSEPYEIFKTELFCIIINGF